MAQGKWTRVMAALLAVALALPAAARAESATDDEPQGSAAPAPNLNVPEKKDEAPPSQPSLDFDLLGETPPPPAPSKEDQEKAAALKTRRLLLNIHQTVGVALAAAEVGAMVTGQLNYDDKFLGGNSGKYEFIHKAFVYPTIGLGTVAAGLALATPDPIEVQSTGFDSIMLHKIGMFTAYAGWLAQLALGLYVSSREGFENQQSLATAHLVVGYVSLAGMLTGLGPIIF